jgi:hypothetical protein
MKRAFAPRAPKLEKHTPLLTGHHLELEVLVTRPRPRAGSIGNGNRSRETAKTTARQEDHLTHMCQETEGWFETTRHR